MIASFFALMQRQLCLEGLRLEVRIQRIFELGQGGAQISWWRGPRNTRQIDFRSVYRCPVARSAAARAMSVWNYTVRLDFPTCRSFLLWWCLVASCVATRRLRCLIVPLSLYQDCAKCNVSLLKTLEVQDEQAAERQLLIKAVWSPGVHRYPEHKARCCPRHRESLSQDTQT